MRSRLAVFVFALAGLFTLAVSPLLYSQPQSDSLGRNPRKIQRDSLAKYVPDEVLVRFNPQVSKESIRDAHRSVGGGVGSRLGVVEGLERVKLPAGSDVHEAVRKYKSRPEVLYAEPNFIVYPLGFPSDPFFAELWNLDNTGQNGTADADIDAPEAWNLTTGSDTVVVAVIDSGIDINHPDLSPNLFRNPAECSANGVDDDGNGYVDDCHGISTVYQKPQLDDNLGHGTHVAGTIGAAGNNGLGVSGVNWRVRLLTCKFLDPSGNVGSVLECLAYVKMMKDRGVNIVASNNSWGGPFHSQALYDAIEAQKQSGILFIAASGNEYSDNDSTPVYPANYSLPHLISVAATDRHDQKSWFANHGRRTVHLGAPGEDILSTTPNGTYSFYSGTSMAAPHVAGVAALLKAQDSSRDWRQIKNLLLSGGDLNAKLSQTLTGRRLNAYGSLACQNSSVFTRLTPARSAIAAALQSPSTIEVLNINCGQPAGDVTVSVNPGSASLTLRDDGANGDKSAGDGVYTAQFTPTSLGAYTLSIPHGEDVLATVLDNYSVVPAPPSYRVIQGTSLDLGDDTVGTIQSPFPIRFGGGSFAQLFVSSNGTISLTDLHADFANVPIPASGSPFTTLVAPFWDDLYPVQGTSQNVFWDVIGTAPARELVIEWRDVRAFDCRLDPAAKVRFQVVLSESTDAVSFQYSDVTFGGTCSVHDRGGSATIGIQISSLVGTAWSQSQGYPALNPETVGDASALQWHIPGSAPASNPLPAVTSITPASGEFGGPGFILTVSGTGFVPASQVLWNGYERATTFISSTQVSAYISHEDLSWAHLGLRRDVSVLNPAPGGGTSNQATFTLVNPVPVITSISPTHVPSGGDSFRLTVHGSGFAPESKVFFGPLAEPTLYYSPNLLVANVHYGRISGTGSTWVQVVTPAPGGGGSAQIPFTIDPPSSTSGPTRLAQEPGSTQAQPPPRPRRFLGWSNTVRQQDPEYTAYFRRPKARSLVKGQASTQYTPLSSSSASPGGAIAGFAIRPTLPADFLPTATATGDFNRDGKQDWVVANGGSDSLWLYLGRGDGTAELPTTIGLKGVSPISVEVADLRGNGILDLIVGEIDTGTVGVLLGNGDGTFGPEQIYSLPTPVLQVIPGDFNGDGHLDVLAAVFGPPAYGPAIVLPGDGTGTLGPPIFSAGSFYYFGSTWADVADVDADGDLDLLTIDYAVLQGLAIFLNNGSGVFKESQHFGHSYFGFVTARFGDFNEDGCPEVLVTDAGGISFRYDNRCDGTFVYNGYLYGLGDVGFGLLVRDVNSDGHLDVVSSGIRINPSTIYGQEAGNLLSVMLGDGTGSFSRTRVYRGESGMFGLASADLDGDGDLDFVTSNQDSDSVSVYVNDGQGAFGGAQGVHVGYHAEGTTGGASNAPYSGFFPSDVDADGDTDLVHVQWGRWYPENRDITVVLNDGSGKFSAPLRSVGFDADSWLGDFVLADFQNNGYPDFLAVGMGLQTSSDQNYISYARSKKDGKFERAWKTVLPNAQGLLGVGDFNRDGKLDFSTVLAIQAVQRLAVFFGDGQGNFTTGPTQDFGNSTLLRYPLKVHVADFNRDAKLDVLAFLSGGDVYQFFGNGDGTFASPRVVLSGMGDSAVVDLDSDGHFDLVESRGLVAHTADPLGRIEYVSYIGQADGSFVRSSSFIAAHGINFQGIFRGPVGPRLADFDGDGKQDLAVFYRWRSFPAWSYVQIHSGRGDGTFASTAATYEFNKPFPPQYLFEVTGDGRADLVELDGWSASFNVLPAADGPRVQLRLVSEPVIGSDGMLNLTLSDPAASDRTVTLTTSDPAITISPTVDVPAGAAEINIPFQVSSAYNSRRVFAIYGQNAGQTSAVYGLHTPTPGVYGFRVGANSPSANIVPSQTTTDYGVGVDSLGGYATSLQWMCLGLPPGATCQFGLATTTLPSGSFASNSLRIATTNATPVGSYMVTVRASDGAFHDQVDVRLDVGDFTVALAPPSKTVLDGNFAQYELRIGSLHNFSQTLRVSCAGLPAAVPCDVNGMFLGIGNYPFSLRPQGLAIGSYPFTLAVSTVDGVASHTVSGELKVGGFTATSPQTSSVTLSVGGTARFTFTLTPQNGFNEQVTFGCSTNVGGIGCAFNPTQGDFTNGTLTTELTVTILARPSGLLPVQQRPPQFHPPGWYALFISLLLALAVLAGIRRIAGSRPLPSRVLAPACALATVVLFAWSLASCGGGGGGGEPSFHLRRHRHLRHPRKR